MPRWDLFAGVAILIAVAMLALARATQQGLTASGDANGAAAPEGADGNAEAALEAPLAPPALLANVALTHGLFGGLLVAAAWYAEVPAWALGLGGDLRVALPVGVALGAGLFLVNEAAEGLLDRSGVEYDERLRELLSPETPAGWVVLLVLVLPTVAGVEELLFRGALIGALAAGYGLPAWGLAVVSSILFGLGHGLQGPGGVAVTGALGFALAAAFVLTGSLLAVIVAHYLVNALEFAVHEGFGLERP